jgi:hypothetical protein
MRNLASIKVITEILPIEGKDRIGLASVDGWRVIVQKDQFEVNGKCVYCEIDSVLPEKPEFEFLRNKNFRIRTMKMAGVISQGICFPLSILPEGNYKVDQDVTDIVGVKQYEPTMDVEHEINPKDVKNYKFIKWLMRFKWYRQLVYKRDHRAGKGFPCFVSKTDETRIQNMPFILSDKRPFVVTEKIDGQSGTFILTKKKSIFKTKYEYIVCSRNLRLFKKDNQSYWKVSDRYNLEDKLKNLIGEHEWIAIQGECIAPNVQGNKYKVSEADLFVFNILYPNGIIGTVESKRICESVGLKFVPIINDNYILPNTVDELLDYSSGQSELGNTLREGLVIRSLDGKTSFKAVDPLFLIKYNE